MTKLYIHVGAAKTGTTFIQNYFHVIGNANTLSKFPFGHQNLGHHGVTSAVMGEDRIWWLNPYSIERLKSEIESIRNDGHEYILSCEAMFDVRFSKPKYLKILKDLFESYEIHIISYIRNQLSSLRSNYNQECKTGSYLSSIVDYYDEQFKSANYGNHLQKIDLYCDVFSNDRVHIISYDENKKDLLKPLESICSCSLQRCDLQPANVSRSLLSALTLQSIAKDLNTPIHGPDNRFFRDFAATTLKDEVSGSNIPHSLRKRVMDDYFEENAELYKKYGVNLNAYMQLEIDKDFIEYSEHDISRAKSELLYEMANLMKKKL